MNYSLIRNHDTANGVGVRVSLFVSGCRHFCKGCFNREAWDFDHGAPFGDAEIETILGYCDKSYIDGLSLLGGEPFEPENRRGLIELCRRFHERFPDKNIWCYTGFVFDRELLSDGIPEPETARELLNELDVLVDGRFVEALKNPALMFRGSSNQRIIDVPASLKAGEVVLLPGKWERTVGTGDIYNI